MAFESKLMVMGILGAALNQLVGSSRLASRSLPRGQV
jgi:hypothetical protein